VEKQRQADAAIGAGQRLPACDEAGSLDGFAQRCDNLSANWRVSGSHRWRASSRRSQETRLAPKSKQRS
jgi:hypothetical protein